MRAGYQSLDLLTSCPSCGESYPENARFCRHCGYYLPSSSPPEQQHQETACNCPARYFNLDDANFCQFCGQALFTPGPLDRALTLENGENIVERWQASRRTDGTVGEEGVLVLTSRKLLWVVPSNFTSAHRVKIAIPLEEVAEVSPHVDEDFVTVMHGRSFRTFRISSGRPIAAISGKPIAAISGKPIAAISGKPEAYGSAAWFKKAVMNQADLRRSELQKAGELSKVQVVLDFSFLKEFMEKGGLVIQKIACTSCGAPILLPESGNSMSCQYCRAEFHIEDIFEKIKQIIEIAGKKSP